MSEKYTFYAFLATLVAIVVLVSLGAALGLNGRPVEALGIGGAVTGLIGVIGTFKPRTTAPDEAQVVTVAPGATLPVTETEPAQPANATGKLTLGELKINDAPKPEGDAPWTL